MTKILIKLIQLYQKHISIFGVDRGIRCKFYPTCSVYAIQALKKYGFWKGLFLSLKRILKCHPFSKGGYDPLQ